MRLLIILMLFSGGSWAAEQTDSAASVPTPELAKPVSMLETGQMSGQLLQLLLGLLLVIGLIFVLAWLVRRVQQSLPVSSSQQAISLLASQSLGPRDRLLLVQVGNEQILLGLTPGNIVPLHVLQEPVVITKAQAPLGSAFAQRLASALKASNKDES